MSGYDEKELDKMLYSETIKLNNTWYAKKKIGATLVGGLPGNTWPTKNHMRSTALFTLVGGHLRCTPLFTC